MKRLDAFDWTHVETELDIQGHATLRGLLTEPECTALAESRRDANAQADTIDLESLKQGRGELRRFRSGLPQELAALRASLYGRRPHASWKAARERRDARRRGSPQATPDSSSASSSERRPKATFAASPTWLDRRLRAPPPRDEERECDEDEVERRLGAFAAGNVEQDRTDLQGDAPQRREHCEPRLDASDRR